MSKKDIVLGGGTSNKIKLVAESGAAFDGALTVGADGAGYDVTFYSGTAGDTFLWDASEEALIITGTAAQTALNVADGNLSVTDDLAVDGTANLDDVDVDLSAELNIDGELVCIGATGDGALADGDNDLIVKGDAEVDGDFRLDGGDIYTDDAFLTVTTSDSLDYRYAYHGLGYVSATAVEVLGGTGLTCVGIEAGGAGEIGSTEGYLGVGDAADFLRFAIPVPELWADAGDTLSLQLQADLHEQAAEECNIDIRLFEYGNTTAFFTDTYTVADGASRAWVSMDTQANGFGDDADLTVDDNIIVVEITATADADDFNIYGVRWKYRVGVSASQQ
jgi:hypothetical protein